MNSKLPANWVEKHALAKHRSILASAAISKRNYLFSAKLSRSSSERFLAQPTRNSWPRHILCHVSNINFARQPRLSIILARSIRPLISRVSAFLLVFRCCLFSQDDFAFPRLVHSSSIRCRKSSETWCGEEFLYRSRTKRKHFPDTTRNDHLNLNEIKSIRLKR